MTGGGYHSKASSPPGTGTRECGTNRCLPDGSHHNAGADDKARQDRPTRTGRISPKHLARYPTKPTAPPDNSYKLRLRCHSQEEDPMPDPREELEEFHLVCQDYLECLRISVQEHFRDLLERFTRQPTDLMNQ